jgi:ubiquinone/menaquinone biosynthesis C-methylase UbiE
MTILLFPGRHLLNTAFQNRYLHRVLQVPLSQLEFLAGDAPAMVEPINQIVFAITSCNRQHSRYNPIPFHVRAIGVDRFARPLEMTFGITYRIIGIPHYAPTPRFAQYVLREIEEQTEGNLRLTPDDCVVLCSTPAVIEMYAQLGFSILPAELGLPDGQQETPIEQLKMLVQAGDGWFTHAQLRQKIAPSTFDLWQDFPDIPRRVMRLWRDPLLNEAGSLTEDRDYTTYAYDMGNRAILQLKYRDVGQAIVPGKIVDEGCADGALLSLIARDFPDSDLIGIEITGEFIARCLERQRSGDFGGAFIHFHQRNITQPLFEDNSINTTICNSTIHELWSYGQQADTVNEYLARKFRQTVKGGRLIIRDVVGPEDKRQFVYMRLTEDDGSNDDVFRECTDRQQLKDHLAGLSTYARFQRFARDFLADLPANRKRAAETQFSYEEQMVDGQRYVVLTLQSAAEFMSKKDYVDNWKGEMNEEFAFWSFSQWKQALASAGFHIIENPNDPESGSRTYTNRWIVENRYQGKVALFRRRPDGRLQSLAYPVTNVVLVGEKPGRS